MTRENTPRPPLPNPEPWRERPGPASSRCESSTHLGLCAPRCARAPALSCAPLSAPPFLAPPPPARTRALRWQGQVCVRAPRRLAARRARAALAGAPSPRCLLSGTWPGAQCQRPPRRRQAEPTGALGQLPPPALRTRNSLLLLLKNPPELVYVKPCKLPARAFAISREIGTCALKMGPRGQIGGFSVCVGGGGGQLNYV